MNSFENFTDRYRRTMDRTSDEALRLGHEYIGCEHLIIALADTSGISADALASAGLNVHHIRGVIDEIVIKGPSDYHGQLPQTPRLKKCISVALHQSRETEDKYIDTGHLLIGIIDVPDSVAHEAFVRLNVHPEYIRRRVIALQKIFRESDG